MENKSPIPIEIRTFFKDEYGKTLLIKGTPGSGKTVFALTLLSMLKGNGAYLSARVDPDTLYMQFPWIKDGISADNILDATQPERERTTKLEEVTMKPLKYTDVPDFLKAVYIRTGKMDNPIVIIDSWDAVAFYMGYYEPKEREKLEHNLCDFSRRTKTKIILIVEYTGQTSLDYLVDGVVVVESEMHDERRLRRMIIQKLRGCPIKNPVSLFSLSDGIFKSFSELKNVEIENAIITDPIPDLTDKRISTGIKDLDQLIAGYAYSSLNLFEGDYLPYEILACAISINSLNLGRYLFLTSTKQYEFINKISPFVKEEYRKNIEVMEDITKLKERISSEEKQKPVPIIILLHLEEVENADAMLNQLISSSMEQEVVIMCYAGREEEKGREMDSIASTHIKTKFISGIPCIYGEMPRTEIYAMELSTSKGFLDITLTPII